MAVNTKIEWCDATWNPWIGCTKVSPACDHCYAEVATPSRRFGVQWGAGQQRMRTRDANWKLPLRWNEEQFWSCACGWRGIGKYLMLSGKCPDCDHNENLSPARRRVFCASLADVFDNEVDPQWRADLFDLIARTPNLDWLLLTKRIGNVAAMVPGTWRPLYPRNVWIGASITSQTEANRDIPKLLKLPAAVRFLSMEPLLGRVDLCETLGMWWNQTMECFEANGSRFNPHGLDWVIVGGESGHHARPMNPDWVRSLRDQCKAAGVPFLFKQWGEWRPPVEGEGYDTSMGRAQPIPTFIVAPDGTVHCFESPFTAGGEVMRRVGKKAAGRALDGVLHTEYPNAH